MKHRTVRGLRRSLEATLVSAFLCSSAWAHQTSDGVVATPDRDAIQGADDFRHPRVKLSATGFSIDTLVSAPVALKGARVDVYPLSERWMRGGIGFEVGTGSTSVAGGRFNVNYGLMGLTAGIQHPGRATPFVEGHLSGGLLSGRQDGSITIGGTTVTGAYGTSWMYGRGVDVGSELYVSGRMYLSLALGWMRATWGAPDFGARLLNPQADIGLVDVTSDSLLWKFGVGL